MQLDAARYLQFLQEVSHHNYSSLMVFSFWFGYDPIQSHYYDHTVLIDHVLQFQWNFEKVCRFYEIQCRHKHCSALVIKINHSSLSYTSYFLSIYLLWKQWVRLSHPWTSHKVVAVGVQNMPPRTRTTVDLKTIKKQNMQKALCYLSCLSKSRPKIYNDKRCPDPPHQRTKINHKMQLYILKGMEIIPEKFLLTRFINEH